MDEKKHRQGSCLIKLRLHSWSFWREQKTPHMEHALDRCKPPHCNAKCSLSLAALSFCKQYSSESSPKCFMWPGHMTVETSIRLINWDWICQNKSGHGPRVEGRASTMDMAPVRNSAWKALVGVMCPQAENFRAKKYSAGQPPHTPDGVALLNLLLPGRLQPALSTLVHSKPPRL